METEELIQDIVEGVTPVKTTHHPLVRAGCWMLVSCMYLAILVGVFGLREDLFIKVQENMYVLELSLALLSALSAGLAASFLCVPDGYQKAWIRWLPVPFFVLLTGLLVLMWVEPKILGDAFISTTDFTFECVLDMLVFSMFPIVVMLYTTKKAATTHYYWSAALASLAAASFSYACVRVIEANDVVEHLLFWHYVPLLAIVVLAMAVARRVLAW